jgi:hypothetical protein
MFDLTLSIIVLSMICWVFTWTIRKISEILVPSSTDEKTKLSKLWREVVLPLLPILIGNLIGLINMYPYPAEFTSLPSHMLFGGFCGAISGVVYRVVMSFLNSKIIAVAKKE